jgi:hypothetical protein
MTTPVIFELAKLLKERGFSPNETNYEVLWVINPRMIEPMLGPNPKITVSTYSEDCEFFSAPTIAEVVMWLYEKHGIWIGVNQMIGMRFYINFWKDDVNRYCPFDSFNSPTEAYLSAIEYSLRNLI